MSRKFTFPAVAFGLFSSFSSVPSALACDPPATKPAVVTSSFAVVVHTRTVKTVEEQLVEALEGTKAFVHNCHCEVDKAAKKVDSIVKERDTLTKTRENAVEKITALRSLLVVPGCSVCIDGKSFGKETVAEVLLQQLDRFETVESNLLSVEIRLQQANLALSAAKAKAKRWKSVESLLSNRVDSVLNASAARESLAAREEAVKEAVALAEIIETKISKSKESSKPVSQTASSNSSESRQESPRDSQATDSTESVSKNTVSQATAAQTTVSEAIAEFDAIFGK